MELRVKDDCGWIIRIKNPRLFKASTNLFCVRYAAEELSKKPDNSRKLGIFELKLINDAINEIRNLHGGQWDKFPVPSFNDGELATFDPLPETIFQYCNLLLVFIQSRVNDLDK